MPTHAGPPSDPGHRKTLSPPEPHYRVGEFLFMYISMGFSGLLVRSVPDGRIWDTIYSLVCAERSTKLMVQAQKFRQELCFHSRRTQHQRLPPTLRRLYDAEDELFLPMVVSRLRPAVRTVGPIEARITWGR
jgi:hypothetical protein